MDDLERLQPGEGGKRQASWKATPHSGQQKHADSAPTRAVPIGDLISLETIVNVLLRKGVCSEEELLAEERQRRDSEGQFYGAQYLSIDERGANAGGWRRPQHPLRKMFSKYRWSRWLGTAVFGWKWKKVKKATVEERIH